MEKESIPYETAEQKSYFFCELVKNLFILSCILILTKKPKVLY